MAGEQHRRPVCEVCGRPPRWGTGLFRLSRADGSAAWHCESCAVRHPRLTRQAVKTALVVGTLLALINHGSVYWNGPLTWALAAKTGLTYCVPFGVAMWGGLMASRGHPRSLPSVIPSATAPQTVARGSSSTEEHR